MVGRGEVRIDLRLRQLERQHLTTVVERRPGRSAGNVPACVRAGIPSIGFHVLRHPHGSIVAAATRDVRAVQRRLRHASASFTLETYVHLLEDCAGVDAVMPRNQKRRREGTVASKPRRNSVGVPGPQLAAGIMRATPIYLTPGLRDGEWQLAWDADLVCTECGSTLKVIRRTNARKDEVDSWAVVCASDRCAWALADYDDASITVFQRRHR